MDSSMRNGEGFVVTGAGEVSGLFKEGYTIESNPTLRSDSRPYVTSVHDLTTHFNLGNGSFEGYAPATIVARDEHLPFKSERTEELVEDLKKTRERDGWGNGQDSPMLAAYITGESEPSIEVYDGLHRQVANLVFQERYGIEVDRPSVVAATIGNTAIHFVTVKPMTRRDMLDKRLTNTRNHPELRFARGGLWSSQLWYLDDISSLAPELSAKQAFNLAERKAKDATRLGRKLGLSPDIVEQVADWAAKRAEAWSVDPSTIYKWIHRAEATSPAVIAQVRNVGKGRDGRGVLSESMIISIANFMPGEIYHDIHTVVINYAAEQQLNDIQFNNLLAEITSSPKIKDASDIEQVVDFLEQFDTDTLDTDSKAVSHRRIRRHTDIFNRGKAAVTSVGDAIDRIAEGLDVRGERAHFVPDVDQRRAAMEAAEALEIQAERALELAERARQQASNLGEDENENTDVSQPAKPKGFGHIRGKRVTNLSGEVRSASGALRDIRNALPDISKHAEQEQWGPEEIDDALEIATVLAEIIARKTAVQNLENKE